MGGAFPSTAEELKKLPGVGAYTAGAVASIAFGECVPALDGNQARVLARVLAWEKTLTRPDELAAEAEKHMPCTRPGDYNQALMDLGALVCTPVRPKCDACPVASLCRARAEGDPMDYPRKRPPVSRREVELTVHLVRAPGGILVRQRPRAGLLGGLWEFPNSEGDARFPDARFIGALPQAKHVFTHLVWRMQGALYRIESVPEGLRAVDLRALDALAMPSAFRVYRDIAREILAKEEKEAAES